MTRRLYSGGHDDRLAQELILGVGGMRALRALVYPSTSITSMKVMPFLPVWNLSEKE